MGACKQLHEGPHKCRVFCFLDEGLGADPLNSGYYTYLSTITRGACFYMTSSDPHSIVRMMVDALLAWMGAEKSGAEKATLPAKLVRYKSGGGFKKTRDEVEMVF